MRNSIFSRDTIECMYMMQYEYGRYVLILFAEMTGLFTKDSTFVSFIISFTLPSCFYVHPLSKI